MNERIRILATSDVHAYCYPNSYSTGKEENCGYAKLSSLISLLRDENTLLIDNGDNLSGAPIATWHYLAEEEKISPMTRIMNHMKYDYINLGNHDFDRGADQLMKHLENVGAPCITSNASYRNKPFGPTYVIRELAGKKIALFGIITSTVPFQQRRRNTRHMTFRDAVETAEKTASLIRRLENPDLVICVYHGGFERDLKTGEPIKRIDGENQGYEIMKTVPGIDILITGHQHNSRCGTLFGKVYTQTESHGRSLACVDIEFNDEGKPVIEPRILKTDTEADEEILEIAKEAEEKTQKWLGTPLGTTDMDLMITDPMQARLHKTPLITLVNRAVMEATGADIVGNTLPANATGLHHHITTRDIVNTYLYRNNYILKKITGKVLREYLEKCAEFWTVRGGHITASPRFISTYTKYHRYDMVDGITYTIKVSNDVGSRITELKYRGEDITDDMEFTIAVDNYRASGGGEYDMFRHLETLGIGQSNNLELLTDYIMTHDPLQIEHTENIRIIL
ncbi:MAG: bifunctional metallophosphatase/5'-nucleotidase [Solobacterium sp.]|nr:bifunctional metallophosphatase/5'-nucleotidase [Solobacterium sp.]